MVQSVHCRPVDSPQAVGAQSAGPSEVLENAVDVFDVQSWARGARIGARLLCSPLFAVGAQSVHSPQSVQSRCTVHSQCKFGAQSIVSAKSGHSP